MTTVTYDYESLAPKVEHALRGVLGGNSTIVITPGYLGRLHVKVVSAALNDRSEQEKQTYLWDVLRSHLGEDSQAVSLVVGYGTDEL